MHAALLLLPLLPATFAAPATPIEEEEPQQENTIVTLGDFATYDSAVTIKVQIPGTDVEDRTARRDCHALEANHAGRELAQEVCDAGYAEHDWNYAPVYCPARDITEQDVAYCADYRLQMVRENENISPAYYVPIGELTEQMVQTYLHHPGNNVGHV